MRVPYYGQPMMSKQHLHQLSRHTYYSLHTPHDASHNIIQSTSHTYYFKLSPPCQLLGLQHVFDQGQFFVMGYRGDAAPMKNVLEHPGQLINLFITSKELATQ